MALTPGTRLGPYEILGPLGAGGMGQVYRARDVKLDRPVAIKVLRDDSAHDPEWRAGFEREARLLATLNHPNIATIYGLDEVESASYIAMELVPGQSLAQRLASGSIPPAEALDICRQLAEGLEAAHDQGVIHRDLKPGNLMLTPDGKVKILDFGLARNVELSREADASTAPYEAQTQELVAAGTPGYSAPEQIRGGRIDRRCDLWALGCILFETITRRRAFPAASFADYLAALNARPSFGESLPTWVPRQAAGLLRRCLEPDVKKRLRDAGDARLELEEAIAELERPATTQQFVPPKLRGRAWWSYAAAFTILALVGLALSGWLRTMPVHNWSGQLLLGGATQAFGPRVSPDGQWLAFIVLHEHQAQVGVMNLKSGEWWVLTRNRERGQVNNICWSRDSTRLYFDRFFDVPVGVYSVSPLDRAPEGAREALVVPEADSPQEAADGSLVVGRLDAQGEYRLHRYSPQEPLRPVGPPIELHLGWPSALRALHKRNAVVFCGRVQEGKEDSSRRGFYLLDLDTGKEQLLWNQGALSDDVSVAVSATDDFVYASIDAEDAHSVIRLPLQGFGKIETLLTLTRQVWGLDVDEAGTLYLDQVQRPLEVIRFAAASAAAQSEKPISPVEHIASPSLWQDSGTIGLPLQLLDGRVIFPSKVGGRDRLLLTVPGKDPRPLLDNNNNWVETAPPLTMVGSRQLALVTGSRLGRDVRLARIEEDGVRPEPLPLCIPGEYLKALAASPGGEILYCVVGHGLYGVPTDPSTSFKWLSYADGVAVNPVSGDVLTQRFDKGGVHLFRRPRGGDKEVEIQIKPGVFRPAPVVMGSGAIDRTGRVVLAAAAKDSWFWRPANLQPDGELKPIPVAYEGDIYPAGWSAGDRVLGMGYAFRSELWRLLPSAANNK